jgi:hypothetical protein
MSFFNFFREYFSRDIEEKYSADGKHLNLYNNILKVKTSNFKNEKEKKFDVLLRPPLLER